MTAVDYGFGLSTIVAVLRSRTSSIPFTGM
jgi:hypothetical protein